MGKTNKASNLDEEQDRSPIHFMIAKTCNTADVPKRCIKQKIPCWPFCCRNPPLSVQGKSFVKETLEEFSAFLKKQNYTMLVGKKTQN